ncbi:putative xylose transporter [Scheffersomyces stipitis CBS 6054]|uniref:Putative xylose transporter n=1 Tax=Scheffersomyces stipitis (strain ATCC 58785 / CBS 6054 / NBRC 10063 / NRRL Y-11545) TaxID=322104 RepID=A3LY79_PICST|nr:putative xylose transporter [Scheffersomyces stipitis CBS 6054]ABN67933.2 putative xylose transporter [Scheffersomyces stipitis CBS 6054]KAG2732328.1 hypothetical protein G9P44_004745 [Scheffersomyces stipitis]
MTERSIGPLIPRNKHLFYGSVLLMSIVHPTIMGYDSMMVGSILNLDAYVNYFHLTAATTGLNTAAVWLGQVIATLTVISYFNDKFGRRSSVCISIAISLVGVALQSAAQNIEMFIIGRIVIGFGISIGFVSSTILVSELAPPDKRGFILGLSFTSFLVGSLIAAGVTYGTRNAPGDWCWRIPSIIQGAPDIVAIINILFISESPRWLIAKERFSEAREIISIISDVPIEDAHEECEKIHAHIQTEKTAFPGNKWKQMVSSKSNTRRVIILFTQAIVTEMAGSSVGSYYFSIILTQAGVKDSNDRLRVNIVMSSWSLVIALSGCLMFDRIGRKMQSLISLSGMIICFIVLGVLVKEYGDGHSKSGSYAAVAMMFLFTGFYSFTFTPLNSLYPPELFPYVLRSTGVTLFNIFNGCWGLFASFILPIAMNGIGWKFYIINACYDVIFLPIIMFCWIETKGINLDTISEVLHGRGPEDEESIEESHSLIRQGFVVNTKK